jgi:hypothetical protein
LLLLNLELLRSPKGDARFLLLLKESLDQFLIFILGIYKFGFKIIVLVCKVIDLLIKIILQLSEGLIKASDVILSVDQEILIALAFHLVLLQLILQILNLFGLLVHILLYFANLLSEPILVI